MRMWSTADVVKLTGVTVRTLRHWDSEPGAEAYRGLAALYAEENL